MMHPSWFTHLRREFEAEAGAEFMRRFSTWANIPESRAAKAVRILSMQQESGGDGRALIYAKCASIISQLTEEHLTGSSSSMPRSQWDNLLAGDGQLWGRVSAIHYLEYEDLKDRAIHALRNLKDVGGGTMHLGDGLPASREELEKLSSLTPPTWRSISGGIRDALVQLLAYEEISAWDEMSFQKTLASGYQLRLNFGKLSSKFGFDYNGILIPADGHGFQLSYERTLGIGVGAWNRISKEGLDGAIKTLVSVTARLEAMIMSAGGVTA